MYVVVRIRLAGGRHCTPTGKNSASSLKLDSSFFLARCRFVHANRSCISSTATWQVIVTPSVVLFSSSSLLVTCPGGRPLHSFGMRGNEDPQENVLGPSLSVPLVVGA
jgi:hypothetical protein